MIAAAAGQLALVCAAMFTAAAIYITAVEQPARLRLNNEALLAEWQPAYARGTMLQAPLALLGAAFGLAAWLVGAGRLWAAGAALMILPVVWTLTVMWPTNLALKAIPPHEADASSRALVVRWAHLHLVRVGLSAAATVAFLWAGFI